MAGLIQRGSVYYAVYYVGKKQKRVSLETDSLQLAKEKLRQLESALYRGNDNPLPTKTPIGDVVTAYIENMKTRKTEKSVQRDVSYLREAFGQVCPALALKNVKNSEKRKKASAKKGPAYLDAVCFEALTTADFSTFIAEQVRKKGLAPKTANRYREVLTRLYNWAMEQNGIRITGDMNPAAKVERYRESAPVITFLSLLQIDEQLRALENFPERQAMVAMYIYAGLRREELCWLTVEDVDFSAGGNGMIRIRAKTIGKERWEPKTKVNRVVPISSALKVFLDRYTPAAAAKGWYFTTPTGCRWDPDNLSRELRTLNKKAKMVWTCLDYRHTFGSQLAMKGESLYKISTLMGNSPEICRKHYAALLPESMIESVEFGGHQSLEPKPVPPATPSPSRLRLVVNN
jgi:integrase